MKKALWLAILGLFVVSHQLISQTKPIIGYGKVAWGVSVDDVRKAYGIGDDVVAAPDQDDPNVLKLIQKDVSDVIKQRMFLFIDNKLYRVWVEYYEVSDTNASNLENALTGIYGEKTDTAEVQQTGNIFLGIYYKTTTITFGGYEPDLEVALIYYRIVGVNAEDNKELVVNNCLLVRYTWKLFRDEYQAKKLEL